MENLAYPIGRFKIPEAYEPQLVLTSISTISKLPGQLEELLGQLSPAQIEQSYRPGGWTVRQLVHHFADSHMNAFVRCKLSTTEDWPEAKPYAEAKWAEQADHKLPLSISLEILRGVHQRWVVLCESLSPRELETKGYIHPEFGRRVPLWEVIPMYAWHCQHHLAHIELVRS